MKKIITYIIILLMLFSAFLLVSCEKEKSVPKGNVLIKFETQTEESIPPKKIPVGSKISMPTPKEKQGYYFDGWYLNGKEYCEANQVTENMTLVANWRPIEYKITYIRAKGTVHTYTIEDEIELPCENEQYYEFYGWSKSYDGSKMFTKIEKGTTGNLTLYAVKECQPYTFQEKSDGTYEITGVDISYLEEEKRNELVIPETHNGKLITSIGERAFDGSMFEKITVSSNIKEIGDHAFYKSAVKSLVIDYGVESIGKYAFSGCENLTTLYFSPTVKKIDNYAFYRCLSLENLYLPSNLVEIGSNAFANCEKLNNVFIPLSVQVIGENAFINCKSKILAQAITKPEKWKIEADIYGYNNIFG
ncbi:MAG: leucine-rich repeat protein [Clostridia bacterium]|nr:leucine-rich repeat protein [Clostridia bacterium]